MTITEEPIAGDIASGISEDALIRLTKELLQNAAMQLDDVEINTREQALHLLELLAGVARNNPLLMIQKQLGRLPAVVTLFYDDPELEAPGALTLTPPDEVK